MYVLDGTEESLKACLDLYNDFSKCSELRINLSKTKAIWIGSETKCSELRINLSKTKAIWIGSETKSLEILLAGE